ncbi:hypothetical protein QFW80_16580 [Luteimonas sp. M1R5S18]|uniref:YkgJ family cysteine cluster protein n=1 Tax=Luteimonas rhizosphaericola TaxID=3042024 RepID=A0ABT6JN79_9GAMM|nr:hypothetical protein [Luteimonas rhizosphaericola]MDH5832135.1 hypothetical protein [Luteimonas rhizosphaericola]
MRLSKSKDKWSSIAHAAIEPVSEVDGPLSCRLSSSVCQRCGACCSAVVDGELVACRHLDTSGGHYSCRIYATRPPVCRDFDCLRTGQPSPAIAARVVIAMSEAAKS